LPDTPPRRQHKRNKTTLSDFADMMMPMETDGQNSAGLSREGFGGDSVDEVPIYRFAPAHDEKPALPNAKPLFAQQFTIDRKPIFPEPISGDAQNTYLGSSQRTTESKSVLATTRSAAEGWPPTRNIKRLHRF
jgi:hypothetical protein